MNETTASIAGSEIAQISIEQYYPELAAGGTIRTVKRPLTPSQPRLHFDLRAEMHATRVHVDELLAAAKIEGS